MKETATEKDILWLDGNNAQRNWDDVFAHFYHKGRGEIYPNELKFWRRLCAGRDNVLEIGAGNGFIARELANADIKTLTLIEPEPANTKILRAIRPERPASTAIIVEEKLFQDYTPPNGTLQDVIYTSWDNLVMFTEKEMRRSLFMRVSALLNPGGLFASHISSRNWNRKVFEKLRTPKIFDMDLDHYGKASIEYRIEHIESDRYRKFIVITLPSGERKTYILPTEAIAMSEVMEHAAEAGLALIEHSADYSGTAIGENPDDHVFVLKKR